MQIPRRARGQGTPSPGPGSRLTGSLYSGDPTLTVADGAIVRFASGAELFTGYDDPGRLVVDGTAQGVLFTPHTSLASPGDWPGISIWNQDSGSALTGLTIEYGGANGFGNLRFFNTSTVGSVNSCSMNDSSTYGIHRNLADPAITSVSYSGNVLGDLL